MWKNSGNTKVKVIGKYETLKHNGLQVPELCNIEGAHVLTEKDLQRKPCIF